MTESFIDVFKRIEKYHEKLGHNKGNQSKEEEMQNVRNHGLAVFMEIAELIDSLPWKPWRKMEDQPINIPNVAREVIDIIFLLGAICEILQIHPWELEMEFEKVLANNYRRLRNGYSKKGGDTNG